LEKCTLVAFSLLLEGLWFIIIFTITIAIRLPTIGIIQGSLVQVKDDLIAVLVVGGGEEWWWWWD
jgi:hypothetical protein